MRDLTRKTTIDDAILLTPDETAMLLRVAPLTLNLWRCLNQGPAFIKKSRRMIRYRLSDIKAWIESGVIDPASKSG